MIEINKVDDDTTYVITFPEKFEGSKMDYEIKYVNLTLTGRDLKKLVLLLNLSIGNLPENAPDITGLVDQITKGIGFQK